MMDGWTKKTQNPLSDRNGTTFLAPKVQQLVSSETSGESDFLKFLFLFSHSVPTLVEQRFVPLSSFSQSCHSTQAEDD